MILINYTPPLSRRTDAQVWTMLADARKRIRIHGQNEPHGPIAQQQEADALAELQRRNGGTDAHTSERSA